MNWRFVSFLMVLLFLLYAGGINSYYQSGPDYTAAYVHNFDTKTVYATGIYNGKSTFYRFAFPSATEIVVGDNTYFGGGVFDVPSMPKEATIYFDDGVDVKYYMDNLQSNKSINWPFMMLLFTTLILGGAVSYCKRVNGKIFAIILGIFFILAIIPVNYFQPFNYGMLDFGNAAVPVIKVSTYWDDSAFATDVIVGTQAYMVTHGIVNMKQKYLFYEWTKTRPSDGKYYVRVPTVIKGNNVDLRYDPVGVFERESTVKTTGILQGDVLFSIVLLICGVSWWINKRTPKPAKTEKNQDKEEDSA